jgi:hypothetical protein
MLAGDLSDAGDHDLRSGGLVALRTIMRPRYEP